MAKSIFSLCVAVIVTKTTVNTLIRFRSNTYMAVKVPLNYDHLN